MKKSSLTNFKYWLILPAMAFMLACNYSKPQLTPGEIGYVQGQVGDLTKNLAKDLATKGPGAWTSYLDTANFFMANDGKLAFKDNKSAVAFIQDSLVKQMSKDVLVWKNMRIDPLSNYAASIGSDYHEELTGTNDKTTISDGYFTATAVFVNDEWKLRNMHWSSVPAK